MGSHQCSDSEEKSAISAGETVFVLDPGPAAVESCRMRGRARASRFIVRSEWETEREEMRFLLFPNSAFLRP